MSDEEVVPGVHAAPDVPEMDPSVMPESASDDGKEQPVPETEELPIAAEAPEGEVADGGEPEWSPTLKYKSFKEEKDFPEWATPLVSSPEVEEQLSKLLSAHDGIDPIKEDRDTWRTKASEVTTQHETLTGQIQDLAHWANTDLGTFFQKADIPVENVIKFVSDHLSRLEDPNAQQRWESNQQANQQAYYAQQENAQLKSQVQQQARAQHELAYQQAFSLPEVQTFQQRFDSTLGEGAFRQHADTWGSQYFQKNGTNTTPIEAVKAVMSQYGGLIPEPSAQPEAMTQQSVKPLPNVGKAKSTLTPTRRRIRSIDDIKKIAEEKYG